MNDDDSNEEMMDEKTTAGVNCNETVAAPEMPPTFPLNDSLPVAADHHDGASPGSPLPISYTVTSIPFSSMMEDVKREVLNNDSDGEIRQNEAEVGLSRSGMEDDEGERMIINDGKESKCKVEIKEEDVNSMNLEQIIEENEAARGNSLDQTDVIKIKEENEKEDKQDRKSSAMLKTEEKKERKGHLDEDKEDGELEEGELEDEEGGGGKEEKAQAEADNDTKGKEEETNEKEQNKENRDTSKIVKLKDAQKDKTPDVKEKKGKDDRKRKHKEFEEEKRKKKKRKHHYSSEDEEGLKKKFPSGREKPTYDFDILLKQEMYLVGSSNPAESFPPVEGHPFQGSNNHFKGPIGESYESCSGEEWEEKPRRRTKRKRRGSRSPSRKNEAICMFYLQGSCKRGCDCPYSHEIAPTRKMELCKFYMMECCAKKEKCLYMHKDFPCKYYHFGMKCKAGELCKFSHEPLQEITRSILLKHIELAPKDILGDFPRVSKHNAQLILNVTEIKRRGNPVLDVEGLEVLLDLEGKGFKYLDRVLKHVRKKKDGEKKGEKEKEEREKSPKKSRNREDYRDSEKDKEREKDRGKERDRDRIRDRDRTREKGRHRPKGDYSQKHRDFHREDPQQHGSNEEPREREGYGGGGRPYEANNRHGSSLSHPQADPSNKWYSSDDEADGNSAQGYRRNPNFDSSPQKNRHRPDDGPQVSLPQNSFPVQQTLPDIDVMYLKNVLSTVQNQSSKRSNMPTSNNQDIRGNNSWDPRSSKYPSKEMGAPMSNYMDISNDIKEVFYDSSDSKEMTPRKDDFASNLDSMIQNARVKASSDDKEFREGKYYNGPRDFRGSFPGSSNDSGWNCGGNLRIREGREDSMNPGNSGHNYKGDNDLERNFGGSRDARYPKESSPWENKREVMEYRGEVEDSAYPAKRELDFQEGERSFKNDTDLRAALPNTTNRSNDDTSDPSLSEDGVTSSIYDFNFRQGPEGSKGGSSDSDDGLNSLPFKVPVHASAKEIDASYNAHNAIYYQLIKVDVAKPDFSRLKLKADDPKMQEDPRLQKMFKMSALESPRSPPRNKLEIGDLAIGSSTLESKDSRDPRKPFSRDPRTDAKSSQRTDPRMARADPRALNSRTGPRMDNRDPRMDMARDQMMDSEMRDSDPRAGGPVFVNGMMEGNNYPPFPNIGGMPNPMMPPCIDPRGRPGLLGPAPPGPGPKTMSLGMHNQLPQGLGANSFGMPQNMGGPPSSYMSGDRDMIGGNGPNFSQNQWSGGPRVNFNDPRINRDIDIGGPYAPSSVS